jgi:hypothetical protein
MNNREPELCFVHGTLSRRTIVYDQKMNAAESLCSKYTCKKKMVNFLLNIGGRNFN